MTLAQIRTLVDDWLAPKWVTVQTRQAEFRTANGHYFQGLITHAGIVPADGTDLATNNTAVTPTDQPEPWSVLVTLPAVAPCALRLDVYHGPLGDGYAATVFVKVLTKYYARTVQVGPETGRVAAWHEVAVVA